MAVTTAESLSKVVERQRLILQTPSQYALPCLETLCQQISDSLQNSRLPGRRPKKVGVFTMETTAHTTLLQNKINNKHDKQT